VRISPSAVIFDYGNVISAPQPAIYIERMAGIFDLPLERFTELYWQFRVPYDAATLTPEEYWEAVAQAASRRITADQIVTLIKVDDVSWARPAQGVGGWADYLRAAGIKTALLSNMPVPVRDYLVGRTWFSEFDVRLFSCDIGVCKPAPEIYLECIRRLGVPASESLFLDDREVNVRAAEALGLHAVLFKDAPAAAEEIERRFSLPVTLSNLVRR
jgi:putative hydrolase of the HAD superfamily